MLVTLQGVTLAYAVSIERRLTRLETLNGIPPGAGRLEAPAPKVRT